MAEPYSLEYTETAVDQLERLPRTIAAQIIRKLEWMAANATDVKHEAMTGNWGGFFRIRVRDYRVIYSLDHARRVIEVEAVGHRSKIYGE